jgi:hypothetical protein
MAAFKAGRGRRECTGRGRNSRRERRRWGKAERLEVGEGPDGRAQCVRERERRREGEEDRGGGERLGRAVKEKNVREEEKKESGEMGRAI